MTFVNNLKGYRIVYSPQAKKVINKFPKDIAQQIYEKLNELVDGKQNLDVKKIKGHEAQRFRLRVGDYRVIYVVWKQQIIVYIVEIGHRREIYRGS